MSDKLSTKDAASTLGAGAGFTDLEAPNGEANKSAKVAESTGREMAP